MDNVELLLLIWEPCARKMPIAHPHFVKTKNVLQLIWLVPVKHVMVIIVVLLIHHFVRQEPKFARLVCGAKVCKALRKVVAQVWLVLVEIVLLVKITNVVEAFVKIAPKFAPFGSV